MMGMYRVPESRAEQLVAGLFRWLWLDPPLPQASSNFG
jgi:hypothetical protein